ncbi:MAG: ferredoxin [Verrucomicrobiota bacterium]
MSILRVIKRFIKNKLSEKGLPPLHFRNRYPLNVEGRFYVDNGCLDCDLCRHLAPTVFKRDDGWSYVYRQPSTEEEVKKCLEAVKRCPQWNVHDDGLLYDWSIPKK